MLVYCVLLNPFCKHLMSTIHQALVISSSSRNFVLDRMSTMFNITVLLMNVLFEYICSAHMYKCMSYVMIWSTDVGGFALLFKINSLRVNGVNHW